MHTETIVHTHITKISFSTPSFLLISQVSLLLQWSSILGILCERLHHWMRCLSDCCCHYNFIQIN